METYARTIMAKLNKVKNHYTLEVAGFFYQDHSLARMKDEVLFTIKEYEKALKEIEEEELKNG
jgi:hypothetical protein